MKLETYENVTFILGCVAYAVVMIISVALSVFVFWVAMSIARLLGLTG
jgi:hypothetical protein